MKPLFLRPSAAHRWKICPLSVSLEAAYPEEQASGPAMEGTAAHWVMERVLMGFEVAEGEPSPNGIPATQEMLEGAALVERTLAATLGPDWRNMAVCIETRVNIPRIHPTQCAGTPDIYVWAKLPDGRDILFLFDYKFGHGIVEVVENDQLVSYAAGLLEGRDDQNAVIAFCVIQPRAYHRDGPVRWWKVRGSDLRAQINILQMRGDLALRPNPPAHPDPDACKYCSARGPRCEALMRVASDGADMAGMSLPMDMTPMDMGIQLRTLTRTLKLMEACASGLQEQISATIKRGQNVPFWRMDSTPGRLTWNKPDAEVMVLGEMFGVNITKPPEPVTPTQAIKAGIPEALVNSYAARPSGAVKLIYDDGTQARLTFASSDT